MISSPCKTSESFPNTYFSTSRFKGVVLVDGRPKVEIIYSVIGGQPQLKLGMYFKRQNLYKVVNMFYREDKIKSTWIKFQHICMYIVLVRQNLYRKNKLNFINQCQRSSLSTSPSNSSSLS